MSPEGREYLAQVAQRETAKAVVKKPEGQKRVENYPKNWGTSTNKRISVTAVWRK